MIVSKMISVICLRPENMLRSSENPPHTVDLSSILYEAVCQYGTDAFFIHDSVHLSILDI